MTQRFWVGALLLLAVATAARSDDKSVASPSTFAQTSLQRLKKLTGTWVATDKVGQAHARGDDQLRG